MKEVHHKIPMFLGGADEKWNLEYITIEKHLERHLDWAEQLNTNEAWFACISFLKHDFLSDDLRTYIKESFGNSQLGKDNPFYGKTSYFKGKKRPRHAYLMKKKFKGEKNPMYGTTHNRNKGKNNPMSKENIEKRRNKNVNVK